MEAGINRVIKPLSFEVDLRLDSHEDGLFILNVIWLLIADCANLFCAYIFPHMEQMLSTYLEHFKVI